ncbi:MAG: MobA/MobL family protein [Lachnospiraceae bacterium]|nr:MobA/MobL family protein [Lachnospiraceae bacterium]
MSIYHCSIKIISRSSGRSAVSAAAYRSGERLVSSETGLIHDYTRKGGVIMNEIILPENVPSRLSDRSILWNEVQQIEKRCDAQFAREIEVALPKEIKRSDQIECVRDFIRENFTSHGMIADWALHDKGDGNPHAHIMLTVRGINEKEGWQKKQRSVFANTRNSAGRPVYDPVFPSYDPGDKESTAKYRIPVLDENGKQKTRVREGKGTEYLWERISIPANDWNEHGKCEKWRRSWSEHCNKYLPKELHIDHRSYERQGLDAEPTIHEGVTARKIELNGKVSDRCEVNRGIRQRNLTRKKLAEEFNIIAEFIISKIKELYERITKVFTGRKPYGAAFNTKETGRDDIPFGENGERERSTGTGSSTAKGKSDILRTGIIRIRENNTGKGRRTGRTVGVDQQLEQRELESAATDKGIKDTDNKIDGTDRKAAETDIRIAGLKKLKQEKENELNDRIRKLMEHRRTGNTYGNNAGGYRQPGIESFGTAVSESAADVTGTGTHSGEYKTQPEPFTEGDTGTEALIRDIEAAILTSRDEERAVGKERSDQKAKKYGSYTETEPESERIHKEAYTREARIAKNRRHTDPCR